jgi:hypothetical protein
MQLETGDILFCFSDSFMSKAIRWSTSGTYSHTALFIVIDDLPFIIDAQADGVNLRPFKEWQKKYQYKWKAYRDPELRSTFAAHRVRRRSLEKVGVTAYDFTSLFLRHPLRIITGKWNKESNPEQTMYCSEYVAWVHDIHMGYQLTPQDLYDKISILGYTQIERNH